MYKCDICGREVFKKIRLNGYTLCSKHKHQIQKYGHPLDNNPRTVNDLNDYQIKFNRVYFNVYNQKCERVGCFIIDLYDIELVKYHKWRLSHGRIVTGSGEGNIRELSHIILGISKDTDSTVVVDYINGDAMDNTRANLRISTQQCDEHNTPAITGVPFDKNRNAYAPEIKFEGKKLHLGRYKTIEEAAYVRLIAEQYLFEEFANQDNVAKKESIARKLSDDRKAQLEDYTISKIQKNFGNKLC